MIIGENMMESDSNWTCTLKTTGRVCGNQKIMSININHNFQQLSSPSASFNGFNREV